jgi:D-aminoacyl-tRNA deacylase
MKAVLQRVTSSSVRVDGETVGAIEGGLMVLLGVADGDTEQDITALSKKIVGLRIFDDASGKMNLSLADTGGELLLVSQFTLCADTRKGRRPAYTKAMHPDAAAPMVTRFADAVRALGVHVAEGIFGANMQVSLCNDGPVTIVLDTADAARK